MSYIQKEFGPLKKDEKGNDIPGSNVYHFKFTQPAIAEIGVLNEGNVDEKTFKVKNYITFIYAVLWGGIYGWYKVKRLEMDFDFENMSELFDVWAKDVNNTGAFQDIINCYLNEVGLLPKEDKKKEVITNKQPKSTRRNALK